MRRFPAFIVIFGIIAIAAVAMQATAQDGPPGGPGGVVPAARRAGMVRAAGWSRRRVPSDPAFRGREDEPHGRSTKTDCRTRKRDQGQARQDPDAQAAEDPRDGSPAAAETRRRRRRGPGVAAWRPARTGGGRGGGPGGNQPPPPQRPASE